MVSDDFDTNIERKFFLCGFLITAWGLSSDYPYFMSKLIVTVREKHVSSLNSTRFRKFLILLFHVTNCQVGLYTLYEEISEVFGLLKFVITLYDSELVGVQFFLYLFQCILRFY